MKPRAVHTVESVLARTVEEGDCRIWTGYYIRKTPQIDVDGKMVSVRRLLTRLLGKPERKGAYFGAKCETFLCVCPDHIVQRDRKGHTAYMARQSAKGPRSMERKLKITQHKRASGKLDMDTAREIRNMDGTYREIAKQFGVSHSLVGHIKRGRYWKDSSNPFAGLGGL